MLLKGERMLSQTPSEAGSPIGTINRIFLNSKTHPKTKTAEKNHARRKIVKLSRQMAKEENDGKDMEGERETGNGRCKMQRCHSQ